MIVIKVMLSKINTTFWINVTVRKSLLLYKSSFSQIFVLECGFIYCSEMKDLKQLYLQDMNMSILAMKRNIMV